MNRGLPRPRNIDLWPVPYNVQDGDHLGVLDAGREREVFVYGLCQTCGHTIIGPAYAVTETNRNVLDNGLLHLECLKLALAWCPHLRDPVRTFRFWRFLPSQVVRLEDYVTLLRVPDDAEEIERPTSPARPTSQAVLGALAMDG